MRVLVVGFGNLLRRDDGFGIYLLRRLAKEPLPCGVRLFEAGIGGIHAVQELLDGYDVLLILDALAQGQPGQVRLLEAEVPLWESLPPHLRQDLLADTHYTEPNRARILARALGVLPPQVYILGAVAEEDGLGEGLSPSMKAALERAVGMARELLWELVEPVGQGGRP